MQAFRLYNGSIIDVQVDVDPSGNPILPPNTAVDPRPEPLAGHYLTINGNQWVQVEIVQPTFEHNKAEKAKAFEAFRDQYMDRPVQYSSVLFDADKQARERLTQALVMHREVGYLAPAWLTYANTPFPLSDVTDLRNIAATVMNAFSTRFFETVAMRDAIAATTTQAELDAIDFNSLGSTT